MTVKLYAFTCGFLTLPRSFLLAKEDGLITVPVPSYLLEHPKGRVVFDTGLHLETLKNPESHVGPAISKYHAFHFHQGEQIGERLKALQIDPNSIHFIINSHLHFDHCGGNEQLPNADIIVQRKEVDHAKTVDHRHGYVAREWETGQKLRLIEGEHDLFNDGTVVCIPTYGHTPGHQSLRVQTEKGGEFLLCGDACYLKESLEKLSLPGIIADREAALSVLKRFGEMRARGVTIVYGHDPDFWKTIPKAPTRLG